MKSCWSLLLFFVVVGFLVILSAIIHGLDRFGFLLVLRRQNGTCGLTGALLLTLLWDLTREGFKEVSSGDLLE